MRRLSANYIYTINSAPLKNGIIEVDDNGKILNIIDTNGNLRESRGLEFYNGILVPGFINTHCHLELSHLKNKLPKKKGLVNFISNVRNLRDSNKTNILNEIKKADKLMWQNGIVACGDISNSEISFNVKQNSKIFYYTFIEVFGLDSKKNNEIIKTTRNLLHELKHKNLQGSISPHSTYALNKDLFFELNKTKQNNIISIHNQESKDENEIFKTNSGELYSFFKTFSDYNFPLTKKTSIKSVSDFLNKSIKTLFVHNTFSDASDINFIVSNFKNPYFSFCPASNLYIENKLPDFLVFKNYTDKITVGSDSLASNTSLNILDELKILSANSDFSLDELLRFATINGANFLGISDKFGSLSTGKTPGINLISGIDFKQMQLTKKSIIKKLI